MSGMKMFIGRVRHTLKKNAFKRRAVTDASFFPDKRIAFNRAIISFLAAVRGHDWYLRVS